MRWTAVLLLVACDAPTIAVAPGSDARPSRVHLTPVARACETVVHPDGGSCEGNDEDSDCIGDPCDPCPNVPSEPTRFGADPATAGPECTHPAFTAATRRLLYEPFIVDTGAWKDPPDTLEAERLRIAGSSLWMGANTGSYRSSLSTTKIDASVLVATAVMGIETFGSEGFLMLRGGGPTGGYFCGVFGTVFAIRVLACDPGGVCLPRETAPDGTKLPSKPFPKGVAFDRFVVRASVADEGSKVRLECQVFPAPASYADVAGTLASFAVTANTVTATIAPVVGLGSLGIVSRYGPIRVDSIDVLGAP
jgi:hypothetical protein